jgi:glycerol-3-phosphate dehydrogenase
MGRGNPSTVSRMHKVVDGDLSGTLGVVSIMGGKITGYRAIAEHATDMICRRLDVAERARTADVPLPGGHGADRAGAHVPPHLLDLYGSRAVDVMRLTEDRPELRAPLSPNYPDIGAQVAFAARHEYCLTLADFIRRRSLLGSTADQGWDAVPAAAAILARELEWTADHQQREITAYARDIARTQSFRSEARGDGGDGIGDSKCDGRTSSL